MITVVVKSEMAPEYKVWANHKATMRMENAEFRDGLPAFSCTRVRGKGSEGERKRGRERRR